MLLDFTISHKPGNTMGITDYISRHPAFEPQDLDDYEEKFVVNRVKEINRLIGTGYHNAVNRLIERKVGGELNELKQRNYVIDENDIEDGAEVGYGVDRIDSWLLEVDVVGLIVG